MKPPLGMGYGAHTMPFVGTMIAAEEVKADANKEAIAADFLDQAQKAGVPQSLTRTACLRYEVPDLCAAAARFCDLSLLPVDDNAPLDQWYAEGVIFGSGHPCLVLPQGYQIRMFQRAVIAWDGSRAAIRSIADSLPLLSAATDVFVVTVAPDKTVAGSETGKLLEYLDRHGVRAVSEVIEAGDLSPAAAIAERAGSYRADVLVMGAFGHTRLRDFILGGVTKHMLAKPTLPVFMAY
jgi:nucleotide-binding universal stress UspA family protein